jgi:hypothetical protein
MNNNGISKQLTRLEDENKRLREENQAWFKNSRFWVTKSSLGLTCRMGKNLIGDSDVHGARRAIQAARLNISNPRSSSQCG